jgi:hypothetical protein
VLEFKEGEWVDGRRQERTIGLEGKSKVKRRREMI